jgi:3-methyladenine DNA glycosylase AlkC
MAEPLKNQYGPEIPRTIGGMISDVFPQFDREGFLADVLAGYEALELMDRGRKIARSLRAHLPGEYPKAAEILVESSRVRIERRDHSMASFLFLPHLCFVGTYGLDHFEESMAAQYELTQRFTAEYSIRPFLEQYPEATLRRLEMWAGDSNVHVRRLVSEGTRPRLPWASRLRRFQEDPQPVLKLLELLKDDPELYVRRSVANNLNDIGKDHPAVLVETARRWLVNATGEREWLVRHALRSAVKRGEPGALGVLGFGGEASVAIENARLTPSRVEEGSSVTLAFDLRSTLKRRQQILVDFCIHFVKASGTASPKTFKLKAVTLEPGEIISLKKSVSLKEMTTRRHYLGIHRVEVLLNGRATAVGAFELVP